MVGGRDEDEPVLALSESGWWEAHYSLSCEPDGGGGCDGGGGVGGGGDGGGGWAPVRWAWGRGGSAPWQRHIHPLAELRPTDHLDCHHHHHHHHHRHYSHYHRHHLFIKPPILIHSLSFSYGHNFYPHVKILNGKMTRRLGESIMKSLGVSILYSNYINSTCLLTSCAHIIRRLNH